MHTLVDYWLYDTVADKGVKCYDCSYYLLLVGSIKGKIIYEIFIEWKEVFICLQEKLY